MDSVGGKRHLRTCVRAGLVAALPAFAIAAPFAAAQEPTAVPRGTERFPTLDRRAQVAPAADFDELRALASRAGHVRVIVGLRVAFTPEGVLTPAAQEAQHKAIAKASAAIRQALSGTDHRVAHSYEFVPVIALELSESALTRLQASGLAATLWEDTPRPPPSIEHTTIEASAVARGGAVAILDTGIARAALRAGRIVSEACFSAHGNCPNGDTEQVGAGAGQPCDYAAGECRHGTQVGVAATGGSGASAGEASPAADLIAIQVFSRFTGDSCSNAAKDPCALSFESDHLAGLQHVFRLRNRFKIGATSLSLGTGLPGLACSDNPLKLAIDNLRSVGIATLIASRRGGLRDTADAPACVSSTSVATGSENGLAAANVTPAATALPDLVITDGALDQSYPRAVDWAVRGGRTDFKWEHTTKNLKARQATRTAPASETAVEFAIGKTIVVEDRLAVPELGPNESKSGRHAFREYFAIFDYGTYKTQICADAGSPPTVKERSEANNCKNMGPFYVIPAHLKGTVAGTWKAPEGFTLDWEGTVDFVLEPIGKSTRLFEYVLTPGTSLTFTVSGSITVNGKLCRWSGTKTYKTTRTEHDSVFLTFRPEHNYISQDLIRNGFSMQYILGCPGIPPIKAPLDLSETPWLDTGGKKLFPDPGLTRLKGDFVDSGLAATYTWDLEALDE